MRAAAAIIKDNKILLIHRFFKDKEYFVLPGGGVEEGEGIEAAAIREIKEETSLDARIDKKLFVHRNDFDKREHHVFLVTDFEGELKLGGEEALKNCESDKYILEWHDTKEVETLKLCPIKTKELLLIYLNQESDG